MAALMYNVSRGLVMLGERSLFQRERYQILVNSRRFLRGLRRRTVAVLYPDGERETLIKSKRVTDITSQGFTQKGKARKDVTERAAYKNCSGYVSERAEESPQINKLKLAGLRFEKAPAGDNRLARVSSVARSRAFRDKEGKVLLEGRRLICDALSAGASPQMIFFSLLERLQELPLDKLQQAKLIKVKYEDIKMWSDLVTPQGLIAIFSKPDASRLTFPKDARLQSVPLFLICDNVRDAGNLGTTLRCAAAAGCDRVLLSKGCVDAWEPKVLRSAMGAHFRLPVFPNLDWDDISKHLPKNVIVHVADNYSTSTKQLVSGQTENASSDDYSESDSDDDDDEKDEDSLPHVKPQVYHECWAQRSTALVIGGETHGLSVEALRLAEETDGKRLFVPMAPGVESLNSAMAAGILLFEGRRQLLMLSDKLRRRARTKML
ncbi:rRNA methyltransferase 3A, mitochondrial [Danio rerio]|uniref:rRNA methyltransferase 3A, mitochondrial n=1 Tax=Danio rerio TaxID=7955 RepID=A0A2R8QBA5_DANRE|nr:rRNA methyltransferase 3A, mitochondrial [Danio rerio]|eukprot:NP_001017695.2 rRNA methyltransferase 3A, mitochondrial [Danio rerio]